MAAGGRESCRKESSHAALSSRCWRASPSVLSRCRVARWRLANMVEEEVVGAATSGAAEATLEVAAWGEVMAEGLAGAIMAALVEALLVGGTSAEAILAASAEAILAGRRD